MWLLSTDRAELRWFPDATAVPGGYAILSHTWVRDEQSFQDIKALAEQCKADGTNPRDLVSDKIRGCCILAEYHGYAWAWVDSCCIDKTSSSELSESINSMFQWYTQAEVCYVYMADVPDNCDIYASDSEYRKSRWHTRGWTLQELIAPAMVIFLSRDWTFLGRRENPALARLLEDITRIPTSLLARSTQVHEYNIATRMSWASRRHTTRLEDEAYCLMGLFDVNVPTIYGEGRRAFQRLQLEIMKNSSDTSIFVWGDRVSDAALETQGLGEPSWDSDEESHEYKFLLARSPRDFGTGVYFTPTKNNPLQPYPPIDQTKRGFNLIGGKGPFDHIELAKFTSTSYGIECRFPIIAADGHTVAVLLCETDRDHLGLLLHEDTSGKDPTRPRYFTSMAFSYNHPLKSAGSWIARIVTLGSDLYRLRFNGKVVKASWRTVYIVPSPSNLPSPTAFFSRLQLEHSLSAAFRIPQWLIATFVTLDFTMGTEQGTTNSEAMFSLYFHHRRKAEIIFIKLGLCSRTSTSASTFTSKWARVYLYSLDGIAPSSETESGSSSHNCSVDHIDIWPMRSKVFKFGSAESDKEPERAVRTSFDPCKASPGTLVIHLELLGPVYGEILRDANISIPARDALYVESDDDATVRAVPLSSTDGVSMPPASLFAAPARVLGGKYT